MVILRRQMHLRNPACPSFMSVRQTEMCRTWIETGGCRYGSRCQFAHGPQELRPVTRHPKYKTQPCRTFSVHGSCPYGDRCNFIHDVPPSAQPLADSSASSGAGFEGLL